MVEDDRLGAGNVSSIVKDEHEGVIIGVGESFTQEEFRLRLQFPSLVFGLPLGSANIYINDEIYKYENCDIVLNLCLDEIFYPTALSWGYLNI